MLLGECLAAALTRGAGYRQVAQRYIDLAAAEPNEPMLLFVVARAYSKLAEIDTRLTDMSLVLRLAQQLDEYQTIGNEHRAIEALLARIAGKMRGTPMGDLAIKTLIEAGRSSRIAAIGGIALAYARSAPVFYISELERMHEERSAETELYSDPPSKRMLGLLFAADLYQHEDVEKAVRLAKADIAQDFPDSEIPPYGYPWVGLARGIPVRNGNLTPLVGTVAKVTLDNMLDVAARYNNVGTVACFTQPRIIEALFQNCGALLIPEQDVESNQCRRLRSRRIPFAMIDPATMALFEDGDAAVVDAQEIRIWSRARTPDWPTTRKTPRARQDVRRDLDHIERKPARPPLTRVARKLMRQNVRPHLEAVAGHLNSPLRLGIKIDAEGHLPSLWWADLKPPTVSIDEGDFHGVNVILHINFTECEALLEQELTQEKMWKHFTGHLTDMFKLFDAWNAAVQARSTVRAASSTEDSS
jgi:hypothetical protein